MADSSLAAIRLKVRNLTRTPSPQQMPDATIDEYINTFILYDFPSHLSLFDLRKTFVFYTQPNIDSYSSNTVNAADPLYNFNNAILTSADPVYVSGYKMNFTQSREDFFNKWPLIKFRLQVATGDGVTTVFSDILMNNPIIPSNTLFTSIDSTGSATGLASAPWINDITGVQIPIEGLYSTNGPIPTAPVPVAVPVNPLPLNSINLVTGAYVLSFETAPGEGVPIYAQYASYAPARPITILYYNDTFFLRPVPDMQYDVKIECNVRPTELLDAGDSPDLQQWWQYIAYGAAKKVLEDRTDMETLNILMPEFMKQQQLVLRRTLSQQGDQRASTIYTDQSGLGASPFGWWYGNY